MLGQWKQLTQIQPRQEWVAQNREALLGFVRSQASKKPATLNVADFFNVVIRSISRPVFQPSMVMLSMLIVFIGSSLFVNAAFYALPGDSLYQVKLTLERAQVAVTPTAERKVELHIQFAKNRVAELDKIVQQPVTAARKDKVAAVVKELKKNVGDVQVQIAVIATPDVNDNSADHQATINMAMVVRSQTADLAKTLNEATEELPLDDQAVDSVETLVAEAVTAVQDAIITADQAVTTVNEAEAPTDVVPVEPVPVLEDVNPIPDPAVPVEPASPAGGPDPSIDTNQNKKVDTVLEAN
jgi:hypothetical protein